MLKDSETQYSRAEKACLSLIYAAQRLRHYFLAHKIYLMTKSYPILSLLRRPVLSGRLVQWLLQLSKFEIIPITPTAVKRQAIADLLAWFLGEEGWNVADEVPGDLLEVLAFKAAEAKWTLRFDGFSTATEGEAGIVLIKEAREAVAMSFKLNFPCTNNTAEYEAYLTGLAVAHEMGIKHLKVIGDSNLVVCQAKGEFALKELSLAPYRTVAQMLEDSFEDFDIQPGMHGRGPKAGAPASDAGTRQGRRRLHVPAASNRVVPRGKARIGPTRLKSTPIRRKSAPTQPKSGRLGSYRPYRPKRPSQAEIKKKKKKKGANAPFY